MIDFYKTGLAKYNKKIKLMCNQCTRKNKEGDAVFIIEGREGTGKTTGSVYSAALAKTFMDREIYMYFHLQDLINKAQSCTGKIFIWDEPALQALGTDSLNKLNRDLIRLLMTCRVNRHFFIINIVDFTKFNQYITVERPLGFVHLFKGRVGHACYIRFKRLESLRRGWDDNKKRLYKKYKSFYFEYPAISVDDFNNLHLTINNKPNATYEDYDVEKKKAIAGIGKDDPKTEKIKLKKEIRRLKALIGREPKDLKTLTERANHYKVDERQLQRWAKLDLSNENDDLEVDVPTFEAGDDASIIKTRELEEKKVLDSSEEEDDEL
jgi:hypothetical protein